MLTFYTNYECLKEDNSICRYFICMLITITIHMELQNNVRVKYVEKYNLKRSSVEILIIIFDCLIMTS